MSKLIGTNPNQVPTNADLGTMAYLDADNPSFEDVKLVNQFSLQRDDFNGTEYLQTNSVEFAVEVPRTNKTTTLTITSNEFQTYRPITVELHLIGRRNGTNTPIYYYRKWAMCTNASTVTNVTEIQASNSGVNSGDCTLSTNADRSFSISIGNTTTYDHTSFSGFIRITTNDTTPITLTYTGPA